MSLQVLSVGQCRPDHSSISSFFKSHFDAVVIDADTWGDTITKMQNETIDLVLVNRLLDRDGSDGLQIVKNLKADPEYRSVPVMLVSNYPEAQRAAVEAGAVPGFGKSELRTQQVVNRVAAALPDSSKS